MEEARRICITLRTDERKRSMGAKNVGCALGCVGDLTLRLGHFAVASTEDFGGSEGGLECVGDAGGRGGGPDSSSLRVSTNGHLSR
jgi:hypothetical protein